MAIRRTFATALIAWALALGFSVRALESPAAGGLPASSQPPAAAPGAQPPANADCFTCHDDDSAARADGSKVVVKPAVFDASIHGGLTCVDCHQDLQTAELPHAEKLAKVDCASCHSDTMDKYKVSAHAKAREGGSKYAASCVDCHGTHDIHARSDPASKTHHLKIAETCS